MKLSYLKIFIFIFILLSNLYPIISGRAKDQFTTQEATRLIYNSIIDETTSMNAQYKQYGGQIIRGFILEIEFSDSKKDDVSQIIKKIEELEFTLNRIEKNNLYLFCNGEKGIWIAKLSISLTMHYESEMDDCRKSENL